MPDITMCNQSLCPNAAKCYRFIAKSSERQSYAKFEFVIIGGIVSCDSYRPLTYRNEEFEVAGIMH